VDDLDHRPFQQSARHRDGELASQARGGLAEVVLLLLPHFAFEIEVRGPFAAAPGTGDGLMHVDQLHGGLRPAGDFQGQRQGLLAEGRAVQRHEDRANHGLLLAECLGL
jgi:hypothetical protein